MHLCLTAYTTLLELSWEGKHRLLCTQLAWKVICRYCLAPVWSWAIPIDWVFFFLPPSLSSLHRSQLSSLPQHSKLVCSLTYCVFPTHAASLPLSLTPDPIHPVAVLTDITSPQACCLWGFKDAAMFSLGCECPTTPFWCGSRATRWFHGQLSSVDSYTCCTLALLSTSSPSIYPTTWP